MKSNRWRALISGEGLKSTHQRAEIFEVFLNSEGHKNLAEIHALVVKRNPKIGYTTVYRTLKLLTRLGLAAERKFEGGETRYEPIQRGGHHDHLICLRCGKIVEFRDEGLEAIQNRIAKGHGFKIFHHRMELYGYCKPCLAHRSSLKHPGEAP
ncbi:MAG: transcriptional repressor [Desulfobacterota bacterium]|nr:transcriptional repressor [Thermodesulfobacteriota bacterium]